MGSFIMQKYSFIALLQTGCANGASKA